MTSHSFHSPTIYKQRDSILTFYLLISIHSGAGIKTQIPPLHHVFTGNPGTGKKQILIVTLLSVFISDQPLAAIFCNHVNALSKKDLS